MHTQLALSLAMGLILCATAARAAEPKPPTIEECDELGRRLEEALNRHDASALNNAFDYDAFCDFVVAGLDVPDDLMQTTRHQMPKVLDFGQPGFLAGPDANGEFRYLRTWPGKRQPRLLFRVLLGKGLLSYVEFLAGRDARGEVRLVDLFQFPQGVRGSKVMRTFILPALKADAKDTSNLSPFDRAFLDQMDQYMAFQKAVLARRVDEALELFELLAPPLQEYQVTLVAKATLLQSRDESEYLAFLHEFLERFPAGESARLLSIDAYSLGKDWPRVFEALDWLERRVGGDAYLDLMRGLTYVQMEDHQAAIKYLAKAVAREDELFPRAAGSMVASSLELKDFVRVAEVLERLSLIPGRPPVEQVLKKDAYAEFRESPECAALLERLSAPPVREDE